MSRRPSPAAGDHDPLFDGSARAAFFAYLSASGFSYDEVKAALARRNLPKPSAGNSEYRRIVVGAAAFALGVDEMAAQVAKLYRPAAHLASAPPPDPDGWADSLIEAGDNNMARKAAPPAPPSLFAPPAPPPAPTHTPKGLCWAVDGTTRILIGLGPMAGTFLMENREGGGVYIKATGPAGCTISESSVDDAVELLYGRMEATGLFLLLQAAPAAAIPAPVEQLAAALGAEVGSNEIAPAPPVEAAEPMPPGWGLSADSGWERSDGCCAVAVAKGGGYLAVVLGYILPGVEETVAAAARKAAARFAYEEQIAALAEPPPAIEEQAAPVAVQVEEPPAPAPAPAPALFALPAPAPADDREIEEYIDLDQIKADPSLQIRAAMSEETISRYAGLMADGVRFPPIVVYDEAGSYWVADGFHRFGAARRCDFAEINAIVRDGGRRAALYAALAANSTHGLARTHADIERACRIVLSDPEWSKRSDRELARHLGVRHPTIGAWRRRIEAERAGEQVENITTVEIPSDIGAIADPIEASKLIASGAVKGATLERLTKHRELLERLAKATKPEQIFAAIRSAYLGYDYSILSEITAGAAALAIRRLAGGGFRPVLDESPESLHARLETTEQIRAICAAHTLSTAQLRTLIPAWSFAERIEANWDKQWELTYQTGADHVPPQMRARALARAKALKEAEAQQSLVEAANPSAAPVLSLIEQVKAAKNDAAAQAALVGQLDAGELTKLNRWDLHHDVRMGTFKQRYGFYKAIFACPDPGCAAAGGWAMSNNDICMLCNGYLATTAKDFGNAIRCISRALPHMDGDGLIVKPLPPNAAPGTLIAILDAPAIRINGAMIALLVRLQSAAQDGEIHGATELLSELASLLLTEGADAR